MMIHATWWPWRSNTEFIDSKHDVMEFPNKELRWTEAEEEHSGKTLRFSMSKQMKLVVVVQQEPQFSTHQPCLVTQRTARTTQQL